jgi:hypothetical protein
MRHDPILSAQSAAQTGPNDLWDVPGMARDAARPGARHGRLFSLLKTEPSLTCAGTVRARVACRDPLVLSDAEMAAIRDRAGASLRPRM